MNLRNIIVILLFIVLNSIKHLRSNYIKYLIEEKLSHLLVEKLLILLYRSKILQIAIINK